MLSTYIKEGFEAASRCTVDMSIWEMEYLRRCIWQRG